VLTYPTVPKPTIEDVKPDCSDPALEMYPKLPKPTIEDVRDGVEMKL